MARGPMCCCAAHDVTLCHASVHENGTKKGGQTATLSQGILLPGIGPVRGVDFCSHLLPLASATKSIVKDGGIILRYNEVEAVSRADLIFDLKRNRGVVLHELLGVFTALPHALIPVREPAA